MFSGAVDRLLKRSNPPSNTDSSPRLASKTATTLSTTRISGTYSGKRTDASVANRELPTHTTKLSAKSPHHTACAQHPT
jgi:hypothetical protein